MKIEELKEFFEINKFSTLSKQDINLLLHSFNDSALDLLLRQALKTTNLDLKKFLEAFLLTSKLYPTVKAFFIDLLENTFHTSKYFEKFFDYVQPVANNELTNQLLITSVLKIEDLLLDRYDAAAKELNMSPIYLNLEKDKQYFELGKSLTQSRNTIYQTDDYVVEFKLGIKREYEAEELMFLAKKIIYYSKVENINLQPYLKRIINNLIKNTAQLMSSTLIETNALRNNDFSFHRVTIKGLVYNFGFFGPNAFKNEFIELPAIDKSKPVIFMFHGMYNSWGKWRPMIKTLSKYFQIVALDMNGYGDSSELEGDHSFPEFAASIQRFVNAFEIKRYIFMGHSAGSFTIQEILINGLLNPEKAVMISSGIYVPVKYVSRVLAYINNTKTRYQKLLVEVLIKNPRKKYWERNASNNDELDYIIKSLNKSSYKTISSTLFHIAHEYNLKKTPKIIKGKYLIVLGEKDQLIDPKLTRALTKIFFEAELLAIEDAGHGNVVKKLATEHKKELFEYLGVKE